MVALGITDLQRYRNFQDCEKWFWAKGIPFVEI